jgi:WD40-like Beta Propeller Repeat
MSKLLYIAATFPLLVACTLDERKKNTIDYLGQTPPGPVPIIFAPGIVSTDALEHSAPAFSPDGRVVLWMIVERPSFHSYLLEMKKDESGAWSKPAPASFTDSIANDRYPSFSPDGKKLYFGSNRKAPAGYLQSAEDRIWEVERLPDQTWGRPVPLDSTVSKGFEYAHSIGNKGTLFFSSSLSEATKWNILFSTSTNGRFSSPTPLPFGINSTGYEDGPFINSDESFLIFESERPEGMGGSIDLYISFKDKDGRWGIPVNMGPKVNSEATDRFARVSPDGKYLFFGSNRGQNQDNPQFDVYWIGASIIDELKTANTHKGAIDHALGEKILDALNKSAWELAAALLQQWTAAHPEDFHALLKQSTALRNIGKFEDAEQVLTNGTTRFSGNGSFDLEMALVKLALNKNEAAQELLAPILVPGPALNNRHRQLAESLYQMGGYKTAAEYFEKLIDKDRRRADFYQLATCYAMIGEQDKAFLYLNKSIETGYGSKQDVENEKKFEGLKADSRWRGIAAKLK